MDHPISVLGANRGPADVHTGFINPLTRQVSGSYDVSVSSLPTTESIRTRKMNVLPEAQGILCIPFDGF